MDKATVYPFVLYQVRAAVVSTPQIRMLLMASCMFMFITSAFLKAAELGFNFEGESIQGSTTLWLGFKEDISVGAVFNLHCRQCTIQQVKYLRWPNKEC
jgi:hypothetical protein